MRDFCKLFPAAIFEAQHLFDGSSARGRLPLIVRQAALLLIAGHRFEAQTDLLFGLAHLDDFEIVLLAHRQGRLPRAPAGVARHFRKVAKPFDALRQFHERPKTRQARDSPMYDIARLVALQVALPGVWLELLDAQRQAVSLGVDIQNSRLYELALL